MRKNVYRSSEHVATGKNHISENVYPKKYDVFTKSQCFSNDIHGHRGGSIFDTMTLQSVQHRKGIFIKINR